MFCIKCGKQLDEQARFCPGCGTMLEVKENTISQQPLGSASVPKGKQKKSKKKVIVLTSVVTAIALLLSIGGWMLLGGKETIYVRTQARGYNAEGVNTSYMTWEYDEEGRLLEITSDYGFKKSFDEFGIQTQIPDEIDGVPDYIYSYEYDDRGNLTYRQYSHSDDNDVQEAEWEYDGDRPEKVTITYGYAREYYYSYDDDENLTSIYFDKKHPDNLVYSMQYDDDGRLIQRVKYSRLEGDAVYEYSYNDEGLLEEYTYYVGNPSRLVRDAKYTDTTEKKYIELKYSDDGQLLHFYEPEYDRSYEYKYDDKGRLSYKTICEDNKERSFEFSYDGDTPREISGNHLYDEKGCLIKSINDDGSYVEYEYKELLLTKEEALRYRRQQQWNSKMFDLGRQDIWESWMIQLPLDPRLLVTPVTEYED